MIRKEAASFFPICGKRAVESALRSRRDYGFRQLLVANPAWKDEKAKSIASLARRKGIAVEGVDPSRMDRWVSGYSNHQGVILILQAAPVTAELEDVLDKIPAPPAPALMVMLDGVTDHQNIGAIARSAAAFGACAIITARDRAAPLVHPSVWRVAQGAVEHLELITVTNLVHAIRALKDRNFWILAAESETGEPAEPPGGWPRRACLVFGSEDKGLRRLTLEHCDCRISIPQKRPGNLDSLNVASATAVLLWEYYRNAQLS